MKQHGAPTAPNKPDLLTLIAVSALAYVLAVALHEHGGHATACRVRTDVAAVSGCAPAASAGARVSVGWPFALSLCGRADG